MKEDFLLIGLDGGATKVNGWSIETEADGSFSLGKHNSVMSYIELLGYQKKFQPVDIQRQLNEFHNNKIEPTEEEKIQGAVQIQAAARVTEIIVKMSGKTKVLIGEGMPGLKTRDQRGISVMANGPRNIEYCKKLEDILKNKGIELIEPLNRLGSDAYYCGMGEEYAKEGQFRKVENSYYLGGGTGAADALKLGGRLVSPDDIKPWFAKTWEMQNSAKISLEKCASAKGIESLFSELSGIAMKVIVKDKIYPPLIHDLALAKKENAIKTFEIISSNIADLIYERITTLFCGWQGIFEFINPNKPELKNEHAYTGTLLDSIVIGQRLGDLFKKSKNDNVLWNPFFDRLTSNILKSKCLPEKAKKHYCPGGKFSDSIFKISKLREAPALGAGIDAYLTSKAN